MEDEINEFLAELLEESNSGASGVAVASGLTDKTDISDKPDKPTLPGGPLQDEAAALRAALSDYSGEVTLRASAALFETGAPREAYLKTIAAQLYAESIKQAKMFTREWCYVNKHTQIWSSPFKSLYSAKRITFTSEFIPQVYTLVVRSNETGEEKLIAENAPTAGEASIRGAMSLGYEDSMRRKRAFARFSTDAINAILSDPRYINEQRNIAIFEAHQRQIESRRYVPQAIRAKWLETITETLNSTKSGI